MHGELVSHHGWRTSTVAHLLRHWQTALNAKFQLRQCSHVGKQVFVKGRVKVQNNGAICIEDDVWIRGDTVRANLIAYHNATLTIGSGTRFHYGVHLEAAHSIIIGRNCLLASYVRVIDSDFHGIHDRSWNTAGTPVVIGDGVWLGPNVVVLKGVTIGDHTIVTANSVVSHDVPANTIVTGNPARVIRHITPAVP